MVDHTKAQLEGRGLDGWPKDTTYVRSHTMEQVLENSTPGKMPKGHGVKTGRELADLIEILAGRLETVKHKWEGEYIPALFLTGARGKPLRAEIQGDTPGPPPQKAVPA